MVDGTSNWRVRAVDNAGNFSLWSSPAWILHVDTVAPVAPVLVGPADGTSINVPEYVLDWNGVTDTSGIRAYELVIGTNGWWTNIMVNGNVTQWTQKTILPPKTYSWFVRAIDRAGNAGSWSATNRYYFKLELYIVAVYPGPDMYATVSVESNIRIVFSRQPDLASLAGNITVERWYNENVKMTPKYTNELVVLSTSGNDVYVSLPNISQVSDLMASYRLTIGAVTSGGSGLQANPVNSRYGAPFTSVNKVMVDEALGGTVASNLDGTEYLYPGGAKFTAGTGELSQSAYITISARAEGWKNIREANDRVRKSRFFGMPADFVAYEVSGANNTSGQLINLGRGELEIRYAEAGGLVPLEDGTISEKELTIYWLNEQVGRWEAVRSAVTNTTANTIKARVEQYGIYAILADRTPVGFDESLLAYPNPFDPTKEIVNLRVKLAKPALISAWVYTIVGERVAQIADRVSIPAGLNESAVTWDGRNGRGIIVVNGAYIIRAEIEYEDGAKESKLWKVAVYK
jgi:hypothetical protein